MLYKISYFITLIIFGISISSSDNLSTCSILLISATILIFALLFVVFTFLTHYTLVYAGTGGLSILSIATGLSDITPFILNLLQGGNIPATIVGACIMQAIISNIVVNMFYAIFFSSRRKEMLPYVWKGFLTVIGVNAVLLLIYYF